VTKAIDANTGGLWHGHEPQQGFLQYTYTSRGAGEITVAPWVRGGSEGLI
jgi:hypothetical protein